MSDIKVKKIDFDFKTFESMFFETGAKVFEVLGEEFQNQLKEERRDYPDRLTIRKEGKGITGKYATTPRDVVDTGDLVESFSIDTSTTKSVYTWDIFYAMLVFTGWRSPKGTLVPPYPWTEYTIQRLNFYRLWKSLFSS